MKLSERASAHGLSARISRLIWNSNAERGIFKTSDGGKSWQALATTDLSDYAHAIREDMVNRDLLSLGTEFGLFISLDGGKQWAVFKGGDFPQVAVRDITVQPLDYQDYGPPQAGISRRLRAQIAALPETGAVARRRALFVTKLPGSDSEGLVVAYDPYR